MFVILNKNNLFLHRIDSLDPRVKDPNQLTNKQQVKVCLQNHVYNYQTKLNIPII